MSELRDTVRNRRADFEGHYRIGQSPRSMKPHNAKTWHKFEDEMAASGGRADFDRLVALAHDQHETKSARYPFQFVTYCIQIGWLERIDD